jgi:hypothetical protein
LGIIGGSGIYDLPGLTNAQSKVIESPWGKPSGALLTGEIAGLPIVFLSRHDKGHRLSPSDINYRANIDVLERAGCDRSGFAVGLQLIQGGIASRHIRLDRSYLSTSTKGRTPHIYCFDLCALSRAALVRQFTSPLE